MMKFLYWAILAYLLIVLFVPIILTILTSSFTFLVLEFFIVPALCVIFVIMMKEED